MNPMTLKSMRNVIIVAKGMLWFGFYCFLQAIDGGSAASFYDNDAYWLLLCTMLFTANVALTAGLPTESSLERRQIQIWDTVTDLSAMLVIFLLLIPDDVAQFRVLFMCYFCLILAAKSALITVRVARQASRCSVLRLSVWIFLFMGWFHGFYTSVSPPSTFGDEPHYLLMTHSMLNDHDLNLHNEYSEQMYRSFYNHPLDPKPSDLSTDSVIRSRGLGYTFSLLLIPSYWLGGFLGVGVFMIFLTQLMLVQTFRLYFDVSQDPKSSFLAVIFLGTTIPILLYARLIYPDLAGALIVITCLRLLKSHHFTDRNKRYPLVFMLLIGVLIFLKFRYFFPSLVLLAAGMSQLKNRPRKMITYVFGSMIVVVGYFFLDSTVFRGELFANRFGEFEQLKHYLPDIMSLLVIPGILLDQESGILWLAPIFFLSFPGIRLWSQPRTAIYWSSLMLFPITLISLLGHSAWHSLPTPPLRYIIPVLPPLYIFSVFTIQRFRELRIEIRVLLVLSVFVSYLSGFLLSIQPDWQRNYADGTSALFEALGRALELPVTSLLPSLTRPSLNVVFWTALIAIPVIRLWRRHHYRNVPVFCSFSMIVLTSISSFLFIGCIAMELYPLNMIHAEDDYLSHPIEGYHYPENPDPFYHQNEKHGWVLTQNAELSPAMQIPATQSNLLVSAKLVDSSKPVRVTVLADSRPVAYLDVSGTYWQDYLMRLPSDLSANPLRLKLNPKETRNVVIDYMQIINGSEWKSKVMLWMSDHISTLGWENLHFFVLKNGLMRSSVDVAQKIRGTFQSTVVQEKGKKSLTTQNLDYRYIEQILGFADRRNWEKLFYFERLFAFCAAPKIESSLLRSYLIDEVKYGHCIPLVAKLTDFHEANPKDLDIELGLAICHYKRNDHYRLIQIFESVLESGNCADLTLSKPENTRVCSRQFMKLLLEIAHSEDYQSAVHQYLGGVMHTVLSKHSEGDFTASISELNRLFRLDPEYARSRVVEQSSDFNQIHLRRLSSVSVGDVVWMTEAFLKARRYDDALICAEKALSLDPVSSTTRLILARTLFARGDLIDARQQCLVGITLTFTDDPARNTLEVILDAIDRRSRAIGQSTITGAKE